MTSNWGIKRPRLESPGTHVVDQQNPVIAGVQVPTIAGVEVQVPTTWEGEAELWDLGIFGGTKKIPPPKQTWNLKMDPWKRRFLLETIISRFHVNFWECNVLGGAFYIKQVHPWKDM